MEIVVGKTAGFCGGVKNAVIKTEKALENKQEIYCLGELVHNEEIIKKLEEKGLKIIEDITQAKNESTVIIRAHGEPPETYEKAKQKNISILDLTCPKVISIHKKAEEYKENGFAVLYLAEGKHPEAIGTIGYLKEAGFLIQSEDEVENVVKNALEQKKNKFAVLAQTTFSMEKFDKIVEKISKILPQNAQIEINKTICNASKIRQ